MAEGFMGIEGIPALTGGDNIYTIVFVIVLIVIVSIVMAVIGVFFYFKIKFNHNIVLWKKINNAIVPFRKDKASLERVGIAGAYWLKTLRTKKYLARPRIILGTTMFGKNTIFYYEREDGEWIEFRQEDIDEKMHQAKVFFISEDMRMTKQAIEMHLEKRYTKMNFLEKYGVILVSLVFFVLITVILVMLFFQFEKVADKFVQASSILADASGDARRTVPPLVQS